MHLRTLLAAVIVAVAPLSAMAVESLPPAPTGQPAPSASDLMVRFGLDHLLPQFGQSLAASPRLQGVTDERFLGAWERGALDTFDGGALNARLEAELARGLEPAEIEAMTSFLVTDFGQKVLALELATQSATPDRQLGIVARGMTLYLDISTTRRAQFEEMMALTSADMMVTMVGESIRGMALGLHLASPRGDIDVPWQDIEIAVNDQLAGLDEGLAESTRAVLAYTYDSLGDGEIETYLDFLRQPGTRKFYALTTLAIGNIVRETMFALGETVAERLGRIDI